MSIHYKKWGISYRTLVWKWGSVLPKCSFSNISSLYTGMVLVNTFAYLHVLLTGWTRRWHPTHWSVTYPGRWVTVSHRCTHTVTRAVAHCNTTSSTQTTKSSQTPLTRNCLRVQKQYSNWGRADGAPCGLTLPQCWAYAFEISAQSLSLL